MISSVGTAIRSFVPWWARLECRAVQMVDRFWGEVVQKDVRAAREAMTRSSFPVSAEVT